MQEQYIDELVFNCLTLECDLGSALNRLITQPGQFAVTPKSKRPGIVRKRKFDTAFLSSSNNYDCKGMIFDYCNETNWERNQYIDFITCKPLKTAYHLFPQNYSFPCS